MTVRSAWLLTAPGGQTREDTRITPLGTMVPESELTTRDGVIAGGNPLRATGAGAMAVQISTGRAVVQGTLTQGPYPVAVTAPETLVVGDGHAQFPRIDSVTLRVLDGLYDTTGQTLARLEVVRGDANSTPAPPALAPATLRLWDINVPAGTSAGTGGINWATALTDRRRYTAAYGGITPPGGPSTPGAYVGQYRDNGRILERWDGSTWRDAAERHYVSVVKRNNYNLAANNYTTVSWDTTDAMTDTSMWSPGAASRLVAPVAGLYTVFAHQTWPNGAKGARTRLLVNGGNDFQMAYVADSNGGQANAAGRPLVLRAGDYVEMSIYTQVAQNDVPAAYSKAALIWQGPA
ncbi:hypothetical protein [Streptomyces xanthochromogenes]|uniref:Minor tail protein n=1 Tax=Streptomyces xanthochromogenes TaxID=67384 RepID=A0ABQ3AST5_9ACTN|nr:hypothetical protein [Streptomyces xanthochromogenes]GGY65674.1 hypothetical protein GCM10010326_70350 [Streptomyces xanthochromogenes]